MPKVLLTERQRRDNRAEKRSEMLADGLSKYKRERGMRNEDLGAELGISRNMVGKLLRKESDIMVPVSTMWILFDIAGIKMIKKVEEA